MEDSVFDPIEAEKKEIDLLNRVGTHFEVSKRWTKWLSKEKTRTFKIPPLCLGCMDRLSGEYMRLNIDEKLIEEDALMEIKHLVKAHAKRCAKIVAIAVLNASPFYPFLVYLLTQYFYWRVDSRMLFQLTVIINRMNNYADFINSIRYLSSVRTTKPQLIEQTNED